jgi:hypothetical protein
MKEEKSSDENIFFQLKYLSHKNIHWAELEKQKSFSKNKSNLQIINTTVAHFYIKYLI